VSLRVVLDTNVVVSAALAPGPPAVCVELVLVGAVEFVASEDLLAEYAAVLDRPRFALPPGLVEDYMAELRAHATIVIPALVPAALGVHSLDRVGLELFTSREATGVAR